MLWIYFVGVLVGTTILKGSLGLMEEDRLQEYKARNYTYPFEKYVPDTPGWGKLMKRRLRQMEFVKDSNDRYNGFILTVASAVVAPNFTENGWGLTRAPQGLVEELKHALHEGLKKEPILEHDVAVIEGDKENMPIIINTWELNNKVLDELKVMHEAWSGVPLVGNNAYGLRVYRNGSHLNMHVDKSETHIISCILHVDHDDDPESEPWPLVIEDFQGNTNEVNLESGDMVFYESSKAFHGRPRKFKGKWYSSIFVHYYPVGWDKENRNLENHYAVPPQWSQVLPTSEFDLDSRISVVGTSMKEPDCDDNWCALKESIVWNGPGKYGEVLTTGGKISILNIPEDPFYSKETQAQDETLEEL